MVTAAAIAAIPRDKDEYVKVLMEKQLQQLWLQQLRLQDYKQYHAEYYGKLQPIFRACVCAHVREMLFSGRSSQPEPHPRVPSVPGQPFTIICKRAAPDTQNWV